MANVIRYFPTQAFNFAFKDHFKKIFNPYNNKTEPLKFFVGNMLSGGFAGAASISIVYPLDLARTRLALDVGKKGSREFNGLFHCIKSIHNTDGMLGLYRGFGMSVAGIFAYRAVYFGAFDTGKANFFPDPKKTNVMALWAFAQTTTVTAGLITYPLDTVRRRL